MCSRNFSRATVCVLARYPDFVRVAGEVAAAEGAACCDCTSAFDGLPDAYEHLPAGNRFLIYTLFPDTNVSLRVHWGPAHSSVIAAVGHSIFNRTCKTSVGDLMSRYGGGGHQGAGTCVLPLDKAADAIDEILMELQANG